MNVDTGEFRALVERVGQLERKVADEQDQRQKREDRIAEIMSSAGLPAPPPEKARNSQRHGVSNSRHLKVVE